MHKLPDLPRIVAFRNVLIHGYATINDEVVWQVAHDQLGTMIATLHSRLSEVALPDAGEDRA